RHWHKAFLLAFQRARKSRALSESSRNDVIKFILRSAVNIPPHSGRHCMVCPVTGCVRRPREGCLSIQIMHFAPLDSYICFITILSQREWTFLDEEQHATMVIPTGSLHC